MENKNTFAEAKIGDRVFDIALGWGIIVNIDTEYKQTHPIKVEFKWPNPNYESRYGFYNNDGRHNERDVIPSLYWDEIKFEVPKKPFDLKAEFEKLEVKEFKHRESNSYLFYNYSFEMWCFAEAETSYSPTLSFFETETEKLDRFLSLLNEHKITPEQLKPLLLEKLTGKKEIAEFIDSRFNKVK